MTPGARVKACRSFFLKISGLQIDSKMANSSFEEGPVSKRHRNACFARRFRSEIRVRSRLGLDRCCEDQ
jgi:hypothetical protein